MTKWCAVPNCKTGSRSAKKQSVFRVPKDTETWKKWEEAIPGIIKLRKTDVVCEKHFNSKDISREWIKLDANGQVIARVAYKYPQLKKLAVPTKFDDDSQSSSLGIANQYEVPIHPSSLVISPIQDLSTSIDVASPASVIGMEIELSTSLVEEANCKPSAVDLFATPKFAEVLLPLRNSKLEENANAADDDFSAYVPEGWSWVNMRTDIVQRTLFTYAVTKMKDGEDCPVAQKSVTLNADGTLKYFVYGRHVDPQDKNIEQVLKEKEMLPDVLGKFKGTNVCNGLGDISSHLVPADNAYYDYVDKGRSKDCSLLSKKKRCDGCTKTRKCIQQRVARFQNRLKMNRIGALLNPNTRKLLAMGLKMRREKCQKIRAQNRVKVLTTCIEAQEAKIASTNEATLDKKCAELNVSESQQLALKEIIAAASKKDGRGRRYTEEWVMLCMLMNIRSPGYYEFLRKNNIMPLPCTRTIRS